MHRFDRKETQPKPVRRSSVDPRPVRIEKGPKGIKFFDNVTGARLTRADAITLMRAYKEGLVGTVHPAPVSPRQRKPRVERPWKVAVYRTSFATKESKLIEEVSAATFLAAASKLASLCMEHVSDQESAVEVLIEQAA